MDRPLTLVVDETIETPKGKLVVRVDLAKIMDDTNVFKDRLMWMRGIPFDYTELSSTDALVMYASRMMTWTQDNNEIIRTVQQHYSRLENRARNEGAIIAMTQDTPDMTWDPEPYQAQKETHSWDFTLPEIQIDIAKPLERRYKQIQDMIQSNPDVYTRVFSILESIFIETERRSRELETTSGFQPGRSDEPVHKKTKSGSVESKA